MKSSVEKLNDTRVKMTVEVPFEELTNEIDQAYKTIAASVNIPGFRKGKAPRKLIDARFGRGPVLEQVVNDALPSRYEAAVAENQLVPLGQPKLDLTKIEDGDVIEFTAEVDVRPDITLPDFTEVSVQVPALGDEEEAVNKELDRLRERFAELKDVDEPVAEDNFVTIDIKAVDAEGNPVDDLAADALSYQVGSKDLMDGLDDAIIGKNKGDEVTFTENDNTITVTINAVKHRTLPEVNEDFVQLASEFDTVDELRADLREQAVAYLKNEQAGAIRDAVLDKVLADTPFEVPAGMVDEQAHAALHQIFGELAHDEDFMNRVLEAQNSSMEQFMAESKQHAEKDLRVQIFLDVLAEQEKPEVSQQELTEHIVFTARSYNMSPEEFMSQVTKGNQLGALFADITRGKALAAALCRVNVTDETGATIDPKEYFAPEAAEEAEAAESTEDATDNA